MRERGFTLLEVLVALAILALVMVVLGQTLGGAIRAYGHLDMKTRAWLVASDKMVEMQVYARWPEVGTQTDKVQQDGEDWQVTTQVTKGPFNGTRRVDIAVTLQEDAGKGGALYTLSGLLGEPAADETGKKPTSTGAGADTNTDTGGTTDASTDSAAAASSTASDWEHP
jgi:general secretion pathway protein I